MAKIVDHANKDDVAKLRQVQLQGRRYAISIEPVYWQCLQDAADELGMRLNHLVGYLAQAEEGPNNLAARLRVFAVKRLRRLLMEARLTPRHVNLVELINAIPSPALAVSEQRLISHVNDDLLSLMDGAREEVVGDPVEKYFRLRFSDPLPEIWDQFAAGDPESQNGSLAYMMPGRVLARRLIGVPIKGARKGKFYCLIILR